MRECLKCKKNIDDKNESAKFCSTSCRVMYNRKHGKTKAVTDIQVQVLYNAMLDLVENAKIYGLPKDFVNVKSVGVLKNDGTVEPLSFEKLNQSVRSFEYYRAAKKDIDLEEDWVKMAAEIEAAANLTRKQKDTLLTTNL